MNILTEIINLLTDNDSSITNALLKIKVFSMRMKNSSLTEWIDKELNGYQSEDELPDYRKGGCNLVGNYINGRWKAEKQILATMNLPDFVRESVEQMTFYQSISVLESYLKDDKMKMISVSIPAEVIGIITDTYQKMGNPYLTVYSAYKQVHIGAVEQIITEVRNKTLDLILKLEQEFGYDIDMQALMEKKNDVNYLIQNIMNQITINNDGDGNVINTGSNNEIISKINISKSDFESLRKELVKYHVDEADIDELKHVITEKPDIKKKVFGPKVNNWIKKMLDKSLNGTWQVGIATAGTLLGELLKKYYGI
jgi:plasmid maintenance system antidote protein VapI